MHGKAPVRGRARAGARQLLLVPVLAAGLTVAVTPAQAGTPTIQGVASSDGQAPASTPADPAAYGRPAGVQTGRRPR